MQAELELPFPVLSDVDAVATRAFGLLHARGGPGGKDVALPAHVLLDAEMTIRWRHVAHRIQERPRPADVLAQIERLSAPWGRPLCGPAHHRWRAHAASRRGGVPSPPANPQSWTHAASA